MNNPSSLAPPHLFYSSINDRDFISLLLDDLDHESQLMAIRTVLRIHKEASVSALHEIEQLKTDIAGYSGQYKNHLEEQLIDNYHTSVYIDAGYSLAAISMTAPMLESMFTQFFTALGRNYQRTQIPLPEHKRWERANDHHEKWNCQFYFDKRGEAKNNIMLGIRQLSGAVGMLPYVEEHQFRWIESMISYRNYMLHGGFEWHPDRRTDFEKLIQRNQWLDFFTSARKWSSSYPESHPGDPWIWYLKDDVIDGMPGQIEAIFDCVGRFIKSLPNGLLP